MIKDDSSFGLYRLILQQAMGAGYRTQSLRQNQLYLKELRQLFEDAGEDNLLRKDETERNRYLFRADEAHRDSNYLFLLYSLCPPGNRNTDFVSAQIMQVLAEEERTGGRALRTNAIRERLEQRWSSYEEARNGWTTKLQPCMERLVERGVLQADPKDARAWRLMPALPARLCSGENLRQLRRLCALIPMLSDRCMPESWGYRAKETLLAILADQGVAGEAARPAGLLKADSRPQLILDDAVLWDILSAYAMELWIQVDYRFPNTGHIVRSRRLQPLKVWTNPGEGRSYLIAREWTEAEEKETRPVILPLDIIVRVWLLERQRKWFSREEQEQYWNRWFSDSFSGISAAECDYAGNICDPVPVKITVRRPDGMTALKWASHRPHILGPGCEQEDGRIVYSLRVTRPEDLEPVLIRYDDIILEVESGSHPFAGVWRRRRELWHQVGIQSPYPPVEVILPAGQTHLEPLWQGGMTPLLHPDLIPRIQNVIRRFNWKLGLTKPVRLKEFLPYDDTAPVPTRLSWAELDWLERFLRDPLVGSMLEPRFRGTLHAWVTEALERAVSSGYVRRDGGDFLYLNRRVGRNTDRNPPAAAHMSAILDAMESGRRLRISCAAGKNRESACTGIPAGLEYYQGTGNLLLRLRNPESGALHRIRCTRITGIGTMAEAAPAGEPEAAALPGRTAQLLLAGDPEFRVRTIGLLQPYLDSVFEDPYGSMRVNLRYPAREEDMLARFLRLLAPGVLLTEGAPPSLCRKYREMFPLLKCAFPPQYVPAEKAGRI